VSIPRVNDAELVALARQGDTRAFGELVDRHRMAVYRAALTALGSHAEAEDAAQDAFVTAFKRLSSFRGEASFKTWLLTIAWNHAINRRRSLARWWRGRREGRDSWDGQERQEGPEGLEGCTNRTPEQIAMGRELENAIVTEIRALAPKLRDALLLAQSGECRYEEIASMLDIPVGTLKWRVSEARKVVKRGLSRRGFRDV
jgi:RNA polymerase sigma-70 factor, ECF subfamily